MTQSKVELRNQLRARRRAIPAADQALAAQQLCNHICELPDFHTAKKLAFYWSHDSEIDMQPVINGSLAAGKECFLPVLLLEMRQHLAFASYTATTPLVPNRYGILEPDLAFAELCSIKDLDIIFVPLLGFDSDLHRLGQGGGFYDACFAKLHELPPEHWPKLIGVGYSCQQVVKLPIDSWDWRLNAVITEKGVIA